MSNIISEHIGNVSSQRIKVIRMVNTFKIGHDDKLWFLWCSSMRSEKPKKHQEEKSSNNMNTNPLCLNDEIKLTDKVR
jgi:hypothetical protein